MTRLGAPVVFTDGRHEYAATVVAVRPVDVCDLAVLVVNGLHVDTVLKTNVPASYAPVLRDGEEPEYLAPNTWRPVGV